MLSESLRSLRTRPIHARAFIQARDLQDLLMNAARSEDITPAALAQVARAWSDLEERKRVLKMRPAPKPIDVGDPRRRRQGPGGYGGARLSRVVRPTPVSDPVSETAPLDTQVGL